MKYALIEQILYLIIDTDFYKKKFYMWMKLSSFIFTGESKAKDGVQRQKKECQELVESNANQNKAKKEKKNLQKRQSAE